MQIAVPVQQLSTIGDTLAPAVSTNVYTAPSANLDLLRSFAVLAVLVAHIGHIFGADHRVPLGLTGVLLFFVHTSLVLLRSLDRLHADGRGSVAVRFFAQRVCRIYPLYLAAMAFTLILQVPQNSLDYSAHIWLGWKWFGANLLLIQNLGGYGSVSPIMWSLPYEMQMYLALPAVWLLARQKDGLAKMVLVSLAAAAVVIIAGISSPLGTALLYVPCFMGGAYAFSRSFRTPIPGAWFPVFLVLLTAVYCATGSHVAQWAVCTVLGFALPCFHEIRWQLLRQVAGAIARYSYGIYLWHWPLLWLCFTRTPGPVVFRGVLFLAALALFSVGSYHLIEAPMVRSGRSIMPRIRNCPRL